MPYQAPEHQEPQNPGRSMLSGSTIARGIAVTDFLVGPAVAAMIIDSPLYSVLASLFVFLGTSATAWGLFRKRTWGWWSAMILHSVVLAGGTTVYVILMVLLVRDFGRPPNHMALINPEGAAVLLTMVFLPAFALAAVPVGGLASRRCRSACGVLRVESDAIR
jgi:ABC-type glycerol-3-phosphate transport system permease component